MKAPACAGAFALRDDQLADAIVSASQSKSGGGRPGRDGGRYQTMRHWITSFQLLTEASDVARPACDASLLNASRRAANPLPDPPRSARSIPRCKISPQDAARPP